MRLHEMKSDRVLGGSILHSIPLPITDGTIWAPALDRDLRDW